MVGNEQRGAQHDLLQPRRMVRRAVNDVDERDEFAPQLAGTYRLWRGVGRLGARKLSTALFGDLFFSPPARLTPQLASR